MQIPSQQITIPAQTVDLGYEVSTHTLTVDTNGFINTSFSAPSGKKFLGSGLAGVPDYSSSTAFYSYPSADGTTWYIQGVFTRLNLVTPTLYLICAAL